MQKNNLKNKYENKKVYIYIDASNIILAASNIGFEVDFKSLFIYLKDRFKTTNIYYITPAFSFLNEKFTELEDVGFSIIKKEIYFQNKLKANCDVELSYYFTRDLLLENKDEMIIFSGDGDFVLLLKEANRKNIITRVFSINKKSTSKNIRMLDFIKVEYLFNLKKVVGKMKDAYRHDNL